MQIDEKGLAKALRVERAAWSADHGRDHGDSPSTASMRAAITAYLSTLSLGTRITLADGTEAMVVPVEPTIDVQKAGLAALAKAGCRNVLGWAAYDCHRAMLSALETK